MVDKYEKHYPEKFDKLSWAEKCKVALVIAGDLIFSGKLGHPNFRESTYHRAMILSLLALFLLKKEQCKKFAKKSEQFLGINFLTQLSDRELRPLALKPQRNLVYDFVGCDLPNNVSANYFINHDVADCWYIEFPPHYFDYIDSSPDKKYIDSLFFVPSLDITAICVAYTHQKNLGCIIEHNGRGYTSHDETDFDAKQIASAKKIAQLLILHYDSKRNEGKAFIEKPLYDKKSHQQSSGKPGKRYGKQNLKKTLFKTILMEYKNTYQKNSRQIKSAAKRKNIFQYAFDVRGHFRWQPYGEKLAKHKLIWIDPYIKNRQAKADPRIKKMVIEN